MHVSGIGLSRSPGRRSGHDTIWPARGSWTSVTFEDDASQSSHRSSLDLLATLEPTVVLSAVAPGETFVEIAAADWPSAIEAAKAGLG
jgi:hypothetical protein